MSGGQRAAIPLGPGNAERNDVEAILRDAGIVGNAAVDSNQQRAGGQHGIVEGGRRGQQVQALNLVGAGADHRTAEQQCGVTRLRRGALAGAGDADGVDVVVQVRVRVRHQQGARAQQGAADHRVGLDQSERVHVVGCGTVFHAVVEQHEVLAIGVVAGDRGPKDDDVLAVGSEVVGRIAIAAVQRHAAAARVEYQQQVTRVQRELRARGTDRDRSLHEVHTPHRHRCVEAG